MIVPNISQYLFKALAPRQRLWIFVFETLVFTGVVLAMGVWLRPQDPMLLHGDFLWPLLVPVLLALRYGSLAGVFAMLCQVVSWFGCRYYGIYVDEKFPETTMLGSFIATLLCGEFADLWRLQLRHAKDSASYALDRLQNLTQRHVLLRLSHDRLEENLLTRPYTVRDALQRLNCLSLEQTRSGPLPVAHDLLNLLSEYCQLQSCSLYPVVNGDLEESPAAILGEVQPLQRNNSLLNYALDHKTLAHIQLHDVDRSYDGQYLVCAPISNTNGNIIGMLVIERLPFLAISQDNLQLLLVLLGFYADLAYYGEAVEVLRRRWEGVPFRFACELNALVGLQKSANIDTTLVMFTGEGDEHASHMLDGLENGLRSLDLAWRVGDNRLLILMPMTGKSGLEGFVLRTEKWLQERYTFSSFHQANIDFNYHYLDSKPAEEQIANIFGDVDV